MQTANIMLALGGDQGTLVPKYGVTASEIAVLLAIHGNTSVLDIEPGDDIERSDREEIRRLNDIYGRAKTQGPNGDVLIVGMLFPGAAARAFQTLEELEIDETFYKAAARVKPKAAEAKPVKAGKKAAEAKAAAPTPEREPAVDDEVLSEEETDKLFG